MELQKDSPWYQYLDDCQRALAETSFALLDKAKELHDLKDYSFIVFPMAKAYEGFLKKVLFDRNLIDKNTYEGRKFRIGRALNPDVRNHQRDEDWFYDDMAEIFGNEVAREMWNAWLMCRNHVFHYWPDCEQFLTIAEVKERLQMMTEVMNKITNEKEDYVS